MKLDVKFNFDWSMFEATKYELAGSALLNVRFSKWETKHRSRLPLGSLRPLDPVLLCSCLCILQLVKHLDDVHIVFGVDL